MVSLGHGTLSFKGSMLERSQSSLVDYGKNVHNKKLGQHIEKKIWDMKIKLSQFNPRKIEGTIIIIIILKVSTLPTRKLNSDVILVMKQDTMPKIVLETKETLTRRKATREAIMLMLQMMMNLPQRETSNKVMILQVMKNMF